MPSTRLIEKPEIPPRSRRNSEHLTKDREEARRLLLQARKAGKAIELTLGPDERDETIKLRYRAVAKAERLKLRFQTVKQRPYRNRKGVEDYEAEVLVVLVA